MDQDMVSFVLRFVREASEEQQARWRGVVKHVQSNSESSFSNFAEAMTFIQKHVNELIVATFDEANRMKEKTGMAGQTNEYNPMMESARLWGEFMKPYTTMVSDTMDEAMSAAAGSPVSQQMKQAMSTSMAAWGLPVKSDQSQMAETLKSLSEQMENLAAKVEELKTQITLAQKIEGSEEE
jgi:hypothetical protein